LPIFFDNLLPDSDAIRSRLRSRFANRSTDAFDLLTAIGRATPTTHIFKLPLGLVGHLQMDMRDSVENEWLCSRLMQAFGLETSDLRKARSVRGCALALYGPRLP
jgi:serine/threonine protein kinase HipA of HipAB toxin-antitoxin module